jgi:hypothetical protein
LLQRPFSISAALNALLVFTVLFPFVPRIVPSSDTQPTFLLGFALSLAVACGAPAVGAKMFRLTLGAVTVLMFGVLVAYSSLLVASATQEGSTIPSRLMSFVQFSAAATWAYFTRYRWTDHVLYRVIFVYAAVTVIYFATNGVIEDTLIRSRAEGAEFLFASGRGARTLAPEPSFFALQVFNVFVLSRVVAAEKTFGRRRAFIWFAIVISCLASTLSAYGAIVLLVVLLATYPAIFGLLAVSLLSSFGVFYTQLLNWEFVRPIKVVLALIESRGSLNELMVLDASFSGRITSFGAYANSFANHVIVGDGFSLYQGGGFISVVSGFGVLALLFFAAVMWRIMQADFSVTTKLVLLAWLLLNFVSGPIGIPILGVIVGLLLRSSRRGSPRTVSGLAPAGRDVAAA